MERERHSIINKIILEGGCDRVCGKNISMVKLDINKDCRAIRSG